MKKIFLPFLLVAVIAVLAFKGNKESTYVAQLDKSGITWIGKKVIGGHNGMISLKEGHVTCDGTRITGGTFIIDMSTIHDIDLEAPAREKLEHHLMSPDFFDAQKYPYATFTIKNINGLRPDSAVATGSLTIKDITKDITFPIHYTIMGKRIEVSAKDIKIDRTGFGVNYGSKNLTSTIANKAIDNEITIGFSVVLLQKGS